MSAVFFPSVPSACFQIADTPHFVGIDCGLDGGICINVGGAITKMVMPVYKTGRGNRRAYDIEAIDTIFASFAIKKVTLIIEDPGAHAQSAAGLKSMTEGFAIIKTLAVAYKIPRHYVRAIEWQREFWKKPQLPKGQKFDTKLAAKDAAKNIWPDESWLANARCSTPHEGLIDAALIAEYGRRRNL